MTKVPLYTPARKKILKYCWKPVSFKNFKFLKFSSTPTPGIPTQTSSFLWSFSHCLIPERLNFDKNFDLNPRGFLNYKCSIVSNLVQTISKIKNLLIAFPCIIIKFSSIKYLLLATKQKYNKWDSLWVLWAMHILCNIKIEVTICVISFKISYLYG